MTARKRITRNGRTVVRRVASPKQHRGSRTVWGGRHFSDIKWMGRLFSGRRIFKW